MSETPEGAVLATDHALALRLVTECGDLAQQMHAAGVDTEYKSSLSDVVTAADRACEALVVSVVRVVAKRQQRRDVAIGNQPHVAALAAIATVGATEGDGAFPTERDAARATIATAHVQLGFIDKSAHRTP